MAAKNMKNVLLNESIHLDKENGVQLSTFCSDKPDIQYFVLELFNCEVFEYSKFYDDDMLTIQLSSKTLDKLCTAYLKYKNDLENKE